MVTEETPLGNPYWDYARQKIAAEDALREAHRTRAFPATIVRPSYTYGETWIPSASGSDYTVAWRMRRGLEVYVPGDGSSLWILTHASDFARGLIGLLGRPEAIGEAFHITSDEVLTWNQIHETIAAALGVAPRLVHIPSDFIASIDARRGASLLGDKAWSVVFDTSKLRRVVPGYEARVPFAEGVRASIAWLEADPSRQRIDANEAAEKVLAAWRRAMAALELSRGIGDGSAASRRPVAPSPSSWARVEEEAPLPPGLWLRPLRPRRPSPSPRSSTASRGPSCRGPS